MSNSISKEGPLDFLQGEVIFNMWGKVHLLRLDCLVNITTPRIELPLCARGHNKMVIGLGPK